MQHAHPHHLLPWLSAMKCLKDANVFSTQFSPGTRKEGKEEQRRERIGESTYSILATANRIMAEIMRRDYGTDHPIYQSPHTSPHPVLLREFLEWLIRVAHARPHPIQIVPSSTSSPSPSDSILARIELLLRDCIQHATLHVHF